MEEVELAFFIGWLAFLVLLTQIWRTGVAVYKELQDQTNELGAIRGLLEDQTRYFVED